MTDNRIPVIVAILDRRVQWSSSESIAKEIIETLDQRASTTKWEGPRVEVLEYGSLEGTWVPRSDLLKYLYTLPGQPLTIADLNVRLENFSSTIPEGDPNLKADCLEFTGERRSHAPSS